MINDVVAASDRQTAKIYELEQLNAELLHALQDLLGENPDVQGGICQHCGRDYLRDNTILTGDCPADDCPANAARAAIAKARGR